MYFNSEPIGGAKPQFNSKSETSSFKTKYGSRFAFLCPAQAYPLPSYRFAVTFLTNLLGFSLAPWYENAKIFGQNIGHSRIIQQFEGIDPLPCIQHGCANFVKYLIIISNCVEPIGGSSPKFSTTQKSASYQESFGANLALNCPAQASPLPSFRYNLDFLLNSI